MLLVIAFHAGVPGFGGGYVGVDVFFVVSGFLITGLLLREVERTGRIDLPRFWARRIRRLLPAASLALVGVAVLTVTLLPATRWEAIAGDLLASAFYLLNWRLAERSVDYLAADEAISPVQHFWSLAVEEQFYVLWPLLIVVLVWLVARGARHPRALRRGPLLAGLLTVAAVSLAWSAHLTAVDAGRAYFVTTTRVWELALGGVVAVAVPAMTRLGRPLRLALGWGGLLAIAYAATRFGPLTPFPGLAALVPTVGAAAVLVAGVARSDDGAARLLALPAMERTGTLSYSLYLWHWPLLVVAAYRWGDAGTLGLPAALAVAVLSVVPAWLAFRLVERPLHRSVTLAARPGRAFAVAALCAVVVVTAALAVRVSLDRYDRDVSGAVAAPPPAPVRPPAPAEEPGQDESPPAEEAPADVVDAWLTSNLEHAESIVPDPIDAAEDNPDVHDDGCYQNQRRTDVVSCVYGDPDAATVVALVGDSHAAHWQPALRVAAESQGWRLETYIKSACFFGDADVWLRRLDREYTACSEWNGAVLDRLLATPPDLVVIGTSGEYDAVVDGTRIDAGPEADAVLSAGLASRWGTLLDAGSDLLVIGDTPWRDSNVPECVAEHRPDVGPCNTDRAWGVAKSGLGIQRAALAEEPRAMFVDLTDTLCTADVCPAVIGGMLVMRDTHHLTATFAASLGPALEAAMVAELAGARAGPASP